MPGAEERNDLVTEVARRARDAAYVAVGLGVIGLGRAQAARADLARQLGPLGVQLPAVPVRELADRARARLVEVGSQLRQLAGGG